MGIHLCSNKCERVVFVHVLMGLVLSSLSLDTMAQQSTANISLSRATVIVDPSEPSYVQYAARDLAGYLGQISGDQVPVTAKADLSGESKTIIAIGQKVAESVGLPLGK